MPTIAWQIIEHPRFDEFDLSSLEIDLLWRRAVGAGTGAADEGALSEGCKPGQGWGMTETSATATSNFGEDYERKPSSCGVPLADGRGEDRRRRRARRCRSARSASSGIAGRSSCAATGTSRRPTAETFVDGWVKTGDLARIDEEGFVYIVDRAKDMLIRGGENIYCVEVENALYEHPAVMDAAVIGLPHRTLGEEPAAVVTLKPGAGATEEELRHFVSQARRVQGAGEHRLLARDAAAQRQRQDPEGRVEARISGRVRGVSWFRSLHRLRAGLRQMRFQKPQILVRLARNARE